MKLPFSRLNRFIKDKSPRELENYCISFDVGTSAVRALIGPVLSMEQFAKWNPDQLELFCTEVRTTNLGMDVHPQNKTLDVLQSTALRQTIGFINQVIRILPFVKRKNIILAGTAVFREVKNKEEVLKEIAERTGHNLQIIEGQTEAYLSLLAIYNTRNKISAGEFQQRAFGQNDAILLIDQGGGSTEISYIIPSNPSKMVFRSVPLGTRDLSIVFKNTLIDQINKNDDSVALTISKLRRYIIKELEHLDGFEDILPSDDANLSRYNIYAYGMGTAIKNCFEIFYRRKLDRWITAGDFNGWIMTSGEINDVYQNCREDILQNFKSIKAIPEALNDPEIAENVSLQLRLMYALPAFELLLPMYGVNSIAYSYFNLRYGIYLHRFVYGMENLLDRPIAL